MKQTQKPFNFNVVYHGQNPLKLRHIFFAPLHNSYLTDTNISYCCKYSVTADIRLYSEKHLPFYFVKYSLYWKIIKLKVINGVAYVVLPIFVLLADLTNLFVTNLILK
jgi:hypothetical protein